MTEEQTVSGRAFRDVVPDDVFDSRPFGFSQAVVVEPGCRTIHVSGQVGWDPTEGAVGSTLEAQTPRAFDNLQRVLRGCGAGLDDVVALRIYVVDSAGEDLGAVGAELRSRFRVPPTATWIRVAGLADRSMLIEVEAVAVVAAKEAER